MGSRDSRVCRLDCFRLAANRQCHFVASCQSGARNLLLFAFCCVATTTTMTVLIGLICARACANDGLQNYHPNLTTVTCSLLDLIDC